MSTVELREGGATLDRASALDGVACLRPTGPLTAATAPSLRARIRRTVLDDGEARLVIDLRAVTAIDAAGIAALLEARRILDAQAGGTLALRTNPLVSRALKGTGTISAFVLWNGPGM